MPKIHFFTNAILLLSAFCFLPAARAADAPAASKVILPMTAGVEKRLTPSSAQVTAAPIPDAGVPGIVVTIQPGKEDYPGVSLKPEGAPWDLSAFGHVEARLTNTGVKPISVALRVDNAGNWQDNPWNTESVYLNPGETGTVSTIFGFAYGHKPSYKLNPAAVVNIMLFTGKSDAVQSFRVDSLAAGGPAGEKPPVDPASVRIKPANGVLLGAGVIGDSEPQISSTGAQAALVAFKSGPQLQVTFPASGGEESISLKPKSGRWDLRDDLEVRLSVRNTGGTPITPRARLETDGGPSDWITAAAPLTPGAASELVVPFASATIANLGQKETGNHVSNDAISTVTLSASNSAEARTLLVESIKADVPPAPRLPAWLGKRPPVEGDWVKTLDDEFDGKTLDPSIWSVYGENYWDKQSHWSKDDVLLGGGVVKLRYEKKSGFNNDDPTKKKSDYAAGYLHTYGRWVQRYGYFEARMKLPTAPGLWPAFWMMPDRGAAAAEQWNRQDTGNGGMEFDIMEHLTRWGHYRYNIAMHYDGYGKDHKQIGSDRIYVQPDKDGFLTCGLLWTPGSAIYYCNGQEVLRWENPRISNVPSILMFTLPMGGWDNNSLDDAKLPDDFVIDYVRVWQRKDLASKVDGKQPGK